MKLVTQLLDNICLCRDLVTSKDIKKISYKLHVFQNVADEVKRQTCKWLDNRNYELDFNAQDLYELSDEICEFLDGFTQRFQYHSMMAEFEKHEVISDDVIRDETTNISNLMKVDTILRECYKILSYMAIIITLWERSK